MKILFITNTTRNKRPYFDPSVRYRCFNFAEELTRLGHPSYVISKMNFEINYESFLDFDVYIFHRPSYNELFSEKIDKIYSNKLLIADFDDYNFDISCLLDMPPVRRDISQMNSVMRAMSNTYEGAKCFDLFTASTKPLLENINRVFHMKNGKVLHNVAARALTGLSRMAFQESREKKKYTLGYFPGTNSHDLDYKIFQKNISKIDFRKFKMLVCGPVNIEGLDDRIEIVRHDLVDFYELPFLMAQCKAVIAPLENTIFNKSKSGIKFFEAALCGCYVLATPIPDIDRFESKLLLKCRNDFEWQENIESIIDNMDEITEEDIKKVADDVDITIETNEFINWLTMLK